MKFAVILNTVQTQNKFKGQIHLQTQKHYIHPHLSACLPAVFARCRVAIHMLDINNKDFFASASITCLIFSLWYSSGRLYHCQCPSGLWMAIAPKAETLTDFQETKLHNTQVLLPSVVFRLWVSNSVGIVICAGTMPGVWLTRCSSSGNIIDSLNKESVFMETCLALITVDIKKDKMVIVLKIESMT